MVKAERHLVRLLKAVPIYTGGFQQHIGANDIGFDEVGTSG